MNSILSCVLLALVVAAVAARSARPAFNDLLDDEWDIFKYEHSKSYENRVEERFRRKVYLENRQRIARHNKNPKNGFQLRMNKLGDLLPHEINSKLNGYRMELRSTNKTKLGGIVFMPPLNLGGVPQSVDWREKGFVTPVKNQGDCGSCWSFSATGALEGQHMRRTGKLVSLSEQNLLDCSRSEGNNGCGGGLMDNAFQYVLDNHGIDTEESYPYEGTDDNQCRFRSDNVGADDKGLVDIPQGDEYALKKAVATVGPVSIAIDASQDSFHFYHSGVYYDEECSSEQLDHGVLVVGYGSENGADYWLVKNSWGEEWGDQGYIKMSRNRDNNCGVATAASFPLV